MKIEKSNLLQTLVVCCLLLCSTTSGQAKDKSKGQKTYLFGLSASFNDSTIYITEIQEVSPVSYAPKTGFLNSRDGYSYQLKSYMQGLGIPHPTCITFYASDRKKIEKRYAKVKKKYTEKRSKTKKKYSAEKQLVYDVRYLTTAQFAYQTIALDEGTVYVDPQEAEAAARKSDKKRKKK